MYKENENWLKNSESFGEIGGKITANFIQGKRKLVREIGRFEKLGVRGVVGIPR